MSKRPAVTGEVADRLLDVELGARIPTTAELAAELRVGYGTVHGALRTLQADRAVTLTTHGHRGTRLVERDLPRLWLASNRGSLVGVLPLPQSLECAGLATAAAAVAEDAGLALRLLFRQGSKQRFGLLGEGRVDWVLSSGAAAAAESSWCDALQLPEYSYYSRGSVVVATAAGRSPDQQGRVAIDRGSHDHSALTLAEFPDGRLVDAAYWWIPDMVVRDEVDAAVWHRTSSSSLLTATGLSLHPLRNPSPATGGELNRAALVYRRDDRAVRAVLTSLFDPGVLAAIQQAVLSRRLPPAF